MNILQLSILWIFGKTMDLFFIIGFGLFLLSSLLFNDKKEQLKENSGCVIMGIIFIAVLTFLGWFYSLGDR
jgi:hypothetical protein